MSDEELQALYAEVRTPTLATIGRDGRPHLSAMWCAVIDGRIAMWTYEKSQKMVNIRRDPRVSCLFEAGHDYAQLRGAHMEGIASVTGDPLEVRSVGDALARRYQPDLSDALREAWVARSAAKRVAFFIAADRVASWDHRKL